MTKLEKLVVFLAGASYFVIVTIQVSLLALYAILSHLILCCESFIGIDGTYKYYRLSNHDAPWVSLVYLWYSEGFNG